MSARGLAALALVASLAACSGARGSGSFDLAYPSSPASDLAAVAERVRATHEPPRPAVAVLIPPLPARGFRVVGLPNGSTLGQVNAPLLGRPVIAGDLVLARVAGSVVAWGFDGAERWRVPDRGFGLVGASMDSGRVALTLGGGGLARRQGVMMVVDAATGAVRLQRAEPHAFGAPALVGDDLFVPWDGQNLSVFDARSGDEVARVHARTDVVGFARREGPAVWYGARALYRLGAESADARGNASSRAAFSKEGVPGSPPFMVDPYLARPSGLDARERVRLAWRPDVSPSGASFAGGAVYSLFHRDVFAMDAATGAVRWAYVHPTDLAGIEVSRDGAAVVDEEGRALFLDAATGRPRWRAELGVPVAQAVLQLPYDFSPRGAVQDDGPRTQVEGLLQAAGGTDTRLMPAQLFAVRALIDIENPEATHALVNVLTHRRFPQELRAAAGEAITHRRNGTEAMLEALEAHQDYLRDVEAPPAGLLARGLAAARERRAVPPLIAHLHDPATHASDLPAVVAALRELGDPSAVPPLVDFLRLYHADTGAVPPLGGGEAMDDRPVADREPLEAALEQAALAVARMGGPSEQRVLDEVAAHPRAPRVVRDAVARSRAGESTAAPAESNGGPDMTFQAPPRRLVQGAIADAFLPQRPALLGCLRGVASRPATVRITFRYDGAGAVSHVIVNPAEFQSCMEPIVQQVRLPESGAAREIGTYNLSTFP